MKKAVVSTKSWCNGFLGSPAKACGLSIDSRKSKQEEFWLRVNITWILVIDIAVWLAFHAVLDVVIHGKN